jgi:hypothetical protein
MPPSFFIRDRLSSLQEAHKQVPVRSRPSSLRSVFVKTSFRIFDSLDNKFDKFRCEINKFFFVCASFLLYIKLYF